jgi:hypothetical protein
MLAVALQRFAVGGDANGMVCHLLQEPRRKDYFLPLKVRPVMKSHPSAAGPKLTHCERNDLTLQHALAVHPPPVLGQECRPRFGIFRHHFQGSGLPPGPRVRRPLQHTQPPAVVHKKP